MERKGKKIEGTYNFIACKTYCIGKTQFLLNIDITDMAYSYMVFFHMIEITAVNLYLRRNI